MRSDSNTPPTEHEEAGFSWLPWGYRFEATRSTSWTPNLSKQLERLIDQLPERILISSEIENLSGSDAPGDTNGVVLAVDYEVADKEPDLLPRAETFAIRSKFSRFSGSRSIVFSLSRETESGIDNPRELLLIPGISITAITVNLTEYERRWASLFGPFPVATVRLFGRWSARETAIQVSAQRQGSAILAKQRCSELMARFS
jgi:hypothetical protein